MKEEEIQEILDELNTVRPEKLNESGKRLYEAIMKIADERDELQQKVNKTIEILENADYWDNIGNELLPLLKGNDN